MKKIIMSLCLVFVCVQSFAANHVAEKSGFYAGIKAGYARIDSLNKDETVGSSVAIHSTRNGQLGWGLDAGYQHLFFPHFLAGLELGYNDNGYSKINADNTSTGNSVTNRVRSTDVDLLATGKYIWNSGWNVFGKAGVAQVYQRDSVYSGNGSCAEPIRRYKPVVDIGAGYDFSQHWNVNVEYRHIFAKNQSSFNKTYKNSGLNFKDVANVDAVYLGLSYFF